MSYYQIPGTPYVPQQPVNPYGGMGTVGLATSLPNPQMQQTQPQRPQPMNGQQPVQQSAQDGGWLLGRPVSSREEFLAIPSDLYGRWTYCPDLRSGVIYCKRLNPNTCESDVLEFYSPEAWRQMQAQQAQQPTNHCIIMGKEIALIPCSHLIMLCRLTPIRFASVAWLIPASALAFSNVSATRKTQSSIPKHPLFFDNFTKFD
nr:MAG TPA: hypothetical protein [Caudoviricetes sp.]